MDAADLPPTLLLVLGGLGTVGGALLLVRAYRLGLTGDRDAERRAFRVAVAALAVGSLAFLGTMALST